MKLGLGAKRILDVFGATGGLLALWPLGILTCVIIRLDSKGAPIIRLERVSLGRVIKIYKFRSMVVDAESMLLDLKDLNERKDGPYFKIKNDPRVTRVGRFLRKYRIDEVPQLINVLLGEMSLVGPRPYKPNEVAQYPTEYTHLPQALSGMTGLSQISGSSSLSFQRTLELDDEYLKNWSLGLDVKILLKTFARIFSDRSAV